MVIVSHLRPGNWIHRKGSSAYGIVNGKLLALLEEDEKERERFEYIELSGELLEAAGFAQSFTSDPQESDASQVFEIARVSLHQHSEKESKFFWYNGEIELEIRWLHQLQNLAFELTGSELRIPESAKIINLAVEK